jgi:hypothetical protein
MSRSKIIIIFVLMLGAGIIGARYFYTTYNINQTAIVAPDNDQAKRIDAQAAKTSAQAWGLAPKKTLNSSSQ